MKDLAQKLGLSLIGILLLGYMLADKGFAHLGVPPIYVGEMVLAFSSALFLINPNFRVIFQSRVLWLTGALAAWCILQTVPYLEEFGLDALRDAATYGYAAFAVIIAGSMAETDMIERFCRLFDKVVVMAVILFPLGLFFTTTTTSSADGSVPLVFLKSGDVSVHLAGAAAFRMVALARQATTGRAVNMVFWACWVWSALWTCSVSRGAMLAIMGAIGVLVAFGFARRQVALWLGGIGIALALLALFSVKVETERREISVNQVFENALSVFDRDAITNNDGDLAGTTEWRLTWWADIVDYVVFGDYFWMGRGFGLSLADADRFQADPEGRLRSPHNIHLTFLARAGVPGLALWLATLVLFAVTLIRAAGAMRRRGMANWHRLYIWVLAYWTAAVINATFDVYIEGPQGGIWFWSIMGFGVAALAAGPKPVHQALAP